MDVLEILEIITESLILTSIVIFRNLHSAYFHHLKFPNELRLSYDPGGWSEGLWVHELVNDSNKSFAFVLVFQRRELFMFIYLFICICEK